MARNVKLYALSTCGWCRKTVQWLDDNKVSREQVYVDKLVGEEREKVLQEMSTYNDRKSFPTLVIDNGKKVIIGFKPEEMEKEFIS